MGEELQYTLSSNHDIAWTYSSLRTFIFVNFNQLTLRHTTSPYRYNIKKRRTTHKTNLHDVLPLLFIIISRKKISSHLSPKQNLPALNQPAPTPIEKNQRSCTQRLAVSSGSAIFVWSGISFRSASGSGSGPYGLWSDSGNGLSSSSASWGRWKKHGKKQGTTMYLFI